MLSPAIALAAIILGFAGTSPGLNQSSRQSTGYKHLIARLEHMPPTNPPPYEVKKFRSTKAKAEVHGVKLLAAHVRDPLHKNMRVNLIGVPVSNPPHNPDWAKMRYKIYSLSGRLIGSRQILGTNFGYIWPRTSSWERVVPYRFVRTIKFVLRDHGEKGYCIRGEFVPKQCSS